MARNFIVSYQNEAFRYSMTLSTLPEIKESARSRDYSRLRDFCIVAATVTRASSVFIVGQDGQIMAAGDERYWRADYSSVVTHHPDLRKYASVQYALKGLAKGEIAIENGAVALIAAAPLRDQQGLAGAVVAKYMIGQTVLDMARNAANVDVKLQIGGLTLSTLSGWTNSTQSKLPGRMQLETFDGKVYATMYEPLPAWGSPFSATLGVAFLASDLIGVVNVVQKWLFGIALFALLVSLLVGQALSRGIARPIEQFTEFTNNVAVGELDSEIVVVNDDELGILARNFNRMIRSLREMRQRDREASPLTGLPGTYAIQREIQERIRRGRPWAVLYFDLDNFKGFNDRYGYERGNKIIQLLARIISETLNPGKSDSFVGHIGGDDFVAVISLESVDTICREIISRFDKESLSLYDPEDTRNGFIRTLNRSGKAVRRPLVSLSIAVVTDEGNRFKSYLEVSEVATEVKNYVKRFPGSNFIRDRRG